MSPSSPTNRPTDEAYLESSDHEPAPELLNQPWFDVHNHAQTLSWSERERYPLAGCEGMIMVAAGYHWTPYRPVKAEDVQYLWDDAINRRRAIEENHLLATKLGLGIHTGVRIEDPESLLDAMADYCDHDHVVAIGETGVTPTQHACKWDLEGQLDVVRGQFALADIYDLPAILHTPSGGSAADPSDRTALTRGYEKLAQLDTEPVFEADNVGVTSLERNLETAVGAGLDESRIVASHASSSTLPYLMEESDCYASFTIGHPWLLGVTNEDIIEAIRTYGPDRLMLDTDCANVLRTDPLAIKRTIIDLYHHGIEPDAIRTVVADNPRLVFDFA